MVTYEVTAEVTPEVVATFESFMRETHIPDVMATGAFESATLTRSAEGRYRMRYEARDAEAIDRYLSDHASRLREDFQARLPSGIALSREIWTTLAHWRP
jgi:hypothetical protein